MGSDEPPVARTLGDLHEQGKIPERVATEYEGWYGPSWRDVTVGRALADYPALVARGDRQLAAIHERLRIIETIAAKRAQAGPGGSEDELIRDVIQELYGDSPAKESVDAVLEVVAMRQRWLRGEPLAPVDPQ